MKLAPTCRSTRARGFTLLELLVAFSILAFGIVGVLRALSSGMVSARNATDQTTATMLAQTQLEQLRWDQNLLDNGESEGDFGELYKEYSWSATAHPVELPELEETDLQRIELTIKWTRGERERSYTIETCMRESDFEGAEEEGMR